MSLEVRPSVELTLQWFTAKFVHTKVPHLPLVSLQMPTIWVGIMAMMVSECLGRMYSKFWPQRLVGERQGVYEGLYK